METSLHILAVVCLLWFAALGVRYLVHMFQLNGYSAKTQFAWMRANLARLLPFCALLVLAVACEYGISPDALRGAVRALKCVPHRMELLDRGPVLMIDDAFNSNPAGAKAALETVALFEDAMKIIVTPGMIELGEKEEACNRALGSEAAAVCDRIVLVGEKQTRPIARGALDAGFKKDKIFVAKTIGEAMNFVYGLDAGGRKKVVLLENDLPDNF